MPGRWIDELEDLARGALPEPVHRYIRQGSATSVTAGEAAASWSRLRLLPRVLREVTTVDTAVSVLGHSLRTPIGVAPTTLQRAADRDGEVAMAAGAAAAGALHVVSSNAGSTFADIAAGGRPWWLQAYLPADRPSALPLLESAVDSGVSAVVLTADTPVVASKLDGPGLTVWDVVDPGWLRVNFGPGYGDRPGHEKATDLGPHDITWLATTTGLPVVVKGVLRPDDARRCVDAGAAGVWVSNHGGRQLDRSLDTARCLAAVVDAVSGDAEVYVDGGIRSGLDALVALALGARAVFLGRPPLYALATEGRDGVSRLLEELTAELAEALRLAGCDAVAGVPRDLVVGSGGSRGAVPG